MIKTSKQDLYNAYRAEVGGHKLPHAILKTIVDESKTFLLGDGFERRLKVQSNDPNNQAKINSRLEDIQFYRVLSQAILDGIIYEGYVDYFNIPLRAIRAEEVNEVYYDPSAPWVITYLRENREVYDSESNSYKYVQIEHTLELRTDPEDILGPQEYKYIYKQEGKESVVTDLNYIPIARIVLDLDGYKAQSMLEDLIHLQLEYNDVRARINESNKHHKPQMYSVGTSMPKVVGRSNKAKPSPIDTPSGSTIFQTSYDTAESSIIHLEISQNSRDAGIPPRIGYIQPQDSPILERQIERVLQELYTISGVPLFLELENARSASSSSSLSVLYEPLNRKTRKRAEYLIPSLNIMLERLNIKDYTIKLPNMMPKNIEAEKLELEKVKNKAISRRTFLLQQGLTVEQAEEEMDNLQKERILAVQFSGVLTDSQDAPNADNNAILDTLDKGIDEAKEITQEITNA